MSAIPAVLAQALLVLAVVCVRPAGSAATRRRLLIQAVLLCLCLLARGVLDRSLLPIACAVLLVAEAAVLLLRAVDDRDSVTVAAPALWPLAGGMLAAWLAYRLLPFSTPAAALGIVLCGMVALLAARQRHAQQAALLTAGHGLLLVVGAVPGPGWPALLMATLPQAVVLAAFCARPAWSDPVGVGEE